MSSPEIRGILFDLDGVIRVFDKALEQEIEARHGLVSGTLWRVLFDAGRLGKAITGQVTDEAWRDEAAGELSRSIGPHAAAALRELGAFRGKVDNEVLAIVRQLRGRFAVGLLTNGTSRLSADLTLLNLTGEFDVIVNSSVTGHVKPTAAAYVKAARQLGLPPENILFIDDSANNVTGARGTGMTAVVFTTAAVLRGELESLGLA